VTESRSLAAGKDRGHPPPLNAQARMPDRIDASVDPVQVSGLDPPRQGAATDASDNQLGSRYHSVLPRRDCCHEMVGRGDFLPHAVQKAPRDASSPPAHRRQALLGA
jgi:hypothetical protein